MRYALFSKDDNAVLSNKVMEESLRSTGVQFLEPDQERGIRRAMIGGNLFTI